MNNVHTIVSKVWRNNLVFYIFDRLENALYVIFLPKEQTKQELKIKTQYTHIKKDENMKPFEVTNVCLFLEFY